MGVDCEGRSHHGRVDCKEGLWALGRKGELFLSGLTD